MNVNAMNSRITIERVDDEGIWEKYLSCYAYINGLSGNEFFLANAGYEAALTVTISCRYQPALMRVTPMQYRIICDGIRYELTSPADNKGYKNEEVIFRAKRIYTEDDGR